LFLVYKPSDDGVFHRVYFKINTELISLNAFYPKGYDWLTIVDLPFEVKNMALASTHNYDIEFIIDAVQLGPHPWLLSAPKEIMEKAIKEGLPIGPKDFSFWVRDIKRKKVDKSTAHFLIGEFETKLDNADILEQSLLDAVKDLSKAVKIPDITKEQIRIVSSFLNKEGYFDIYLSGLPVSIRNSISTNTIKTNYRMPGKLLFYGLLKKYKGTVTFEPYLENPDKKIRKMKGEEFTLWVEEQLKG